MFSNVPLPIHVYLFIFTYLAYIPTYPPTYVFATHPFIAYPT
jgi:hypothetical protein